MNDLIATVMAIILSSQGLSADINIGNPSEKYDITESTSTIEMESENENINEEIDPYKDLNVTNVVEKVYVDEFSLYSDIMKPSGLRAKEIDKLLEDTPLHGLGWAFEFNEVTYGVNVFYSIGVAQVESSMGKSNRSHNTNDLFGMKGLSFDSFGDSILYFGELMNKYQNRGIEMAPITINPVYCTSTNRWCHEVVDVMNDYLILSHEICL